MSMLNKLKTGILLGALTGLLLFAGQLLGGYFGLAIGLVIAVAMNFGSYWFSDKIVLKMYKAEPVSERSAPRLYKMVKELAQKAHIPMPRVYTMPSSSPNAFATGRDPQHGVVAVTQGIMDLLSEEELKGVIAHEMSHIKNRDTLIASIAATIAGVISFIANIAQFAAIFGGFGGDDDNNLIGMLVLAILTPIIATVIQLAISRTREYAADANAAKLLHNGEALASALMKLKKGAQHRPMKGNTSAASLFIVNPFTKQGLSTLFSTHPPIEERVKRLRAHS